MKNLEKAIEKNKGTRRPKEYGIMMSELFKGRQFTEKTKRNMSLSAKERSLNRLCCFVCKKELPSNSFGSHKRFCK